MPLFAFFVADLVEEMPCQEANMDTQESVAIENTTDADDVAVFGASTSTSTAPIPSASTPKRIGTVSTVITRYFAPVAKPAAGGRQERGERMVYYTLEWTEQGRFKQSATWREGVGAGILVRVPTHVDQPTGRIDESLKMPRS